MKNLTLFAFCFEALLSSVAYGALYMSSLDFLLKIGIGAVVVLFAGLSEMREMQRSRSIEAAAKLNEVGLRIIEAKLNDPQAPSLDAAYQEHLKREHLLAVAGGGGSSYILMICVKFAIWLGGGALMSSYVLPELLKKYI